MLLPFLLQVWRVWWSFLSAHSFPSSSCAFCPCFHVCFQLYFLFLFHWRAPKMLLSELSQFPGLFSFKVLTMLITSTLTSNLQPHSFLHSVSVSRAALLPFAVLHLILLEFEEVSYITSVCLPFYFGVPLVPTLEVTCVRLGMGNFFSVFASLAFIGPSSSF